MSGLALFVGGLLVGWGLATVRANARLAKIRTTLMSLGLTFDDLEPEEGGDPE